MAVLDMPAPIFPQAALDALRAWLRIGLSDDDTLLRSQLDGAYGLCERFTGLALLRREFRDMLPVSGDWQALVQRPVVALTAVEGVPSEGPTFPLAVDSYAIDIDAERAGRVRIARPGSAARVIVTYEAGLAEDWEDLSEPLRLGILRMAAHGYRARDDGEASAPPAAIAALWRPFRLIHFGI